VIGADLHVCPTCQVRGTVRLEPGQPCPSCLAAAAWSRYENETLVIGDGDIAESLARRHGERPRLWRRLSPLIPLAAALALAVGAGLSAVALASRRGPQSVASLLADELGDARAATLLGLAAIAVGACGLLRLGRHRQHRSKPLLFLHSLAVVGATVSAIVGALGWIGTAGYSAFRYLEMPARTELGISAGVVERVVAATAVIVTPDGSGDFTSPGVGTGAVIASDAGHAWIVTCNHVAMAYVSPASWRDAAAAQPVWVVLADGRGTVGHVRWTAAPPLDVALVEVAIADPPQPVRIAADSRLLEPQAAVLFVPNPFRLGWKVHHGSVVRRESHQTPAGEFSLLFTDLPVQQGDSGSGLFDATGALVGLNTWTRADPTGPKGISLPAEVMHAMVDAVRTDRLGDLATEGTR